MNWCLRWFYEWATYYSVQEGPKTCSVCHLPTKQTAPLSEVLRPTFTDHDLIDEDGDGACPACAWYFDHSELRRAHWVVTESDAQALAKKDILPLLAEHLDSPPDLPRYYLISRAKRKHVALRARLNAAGSNLLRVNFELSLVDINRGFFGILNDIVKLRRYHSWDEIRDDKYLPYAILRWDDLGDFQATRQNLQPHLRSPQYELARFLYSPDLAKEGEQYGLPI